MSNIFLQALKSFFVPIDMLLVSFGESGNAREYLKEGWRPPEENRQWSVGYFARIRIATDRLPRKEKLFLVCKMSSFLVPEKWDKQRVVVEVNGEVLVQWEFHSTSFLTKVISIPKAINNKGSIDLTFRTPDACSPFELGLSADKDKLGVCLSFLAITSDRFIETFVAKKGRSGKLRSLNDLQQHLQQSQELECKYAVYENVLAFINFNKTQWTYSVYCDACLKKDGIGLVSKKKTIDQISFREHLVCSSCGLKSRQRYIVSTLRERLEPIDEKSKIYVYEQGEPFYDYLVKEFPEHSFLGSEYLGHGFKPGQYVDGIRNEDALHLSFLDSEFDVLISCDVFEHVPDIEKAISEAFRVLKKGGCLMFSVPFNSREYETKRRAILNNNEIELFCPPEYHGNPLDPNGSLVFYDFGWDLLDICKRAGFRESYAVKYWGADRGYLGAGELFQFIAEK